MTRQTLSGNLARAVKELDTKQREAVLHGGSAVVVAGPGSGKTKTLVTKVGLLLEAEVSPMRGVSCITYTNGAALEVSRRLARLGIHPGERLASATVHSWCLNNVLRRYRSLHNVPLSDPLVICSEQRAEAIAERCLISAGARFGKVEWEMPHFTRIRRALAAGEDTSRFETEKVTAALDYEFKLEQLGLIDFEAMVGRALRAILEEPEIPRLIAARFPWLVVDEYQDLGPVLHRIVEELHDAASIEIFCVGDPDQSVMGFTGADPRYLLELESRPDVEAFRLQRNYRSGSAILAAAELALGEKRDYEAVGNTADSGVVEVVAVGGGLDDHARAAAEKIAASIDSGVPAHEIAVLYPGRGLLLTQLVNVFTAAGVPFVNERDSMLPAGPLVEFIRACAARAAAGPQSCGWRCGPAAAPTLSLIAAEYFRVCDRAGIGRPSYFRTTELLNNAIDGNGTADNNRATESFGEWLAALDELLELSAMGDLSEDERDRAAIAGLRRFAEREESNVEDLASGIIRGKVVLTTYHSSKGREFDLMVLPGLVEGVMPKLLWDGRRWLEPAPQVVAESRRAFYVGITRARAGAILIHGPGYFNNGGYWNGFGPSRFVREILE